ncbi:glycoside hydrolase family 99-like domain-containing protein [Paenibacillus sp. FSL R7-0312]|uniref:glycoside hydrolase family 99-like domain-containing protein n=1 Tax=Paenibacillus sp. FSL R7-0312 TaxID=2921682 RepID=UPI0030FB921D
MKRMMKVSSLYGLESNATNEPSSEWVSINNDPQMYFKEAYTKGFYKIVWHGASSDTRYLRLYINYGGGYSQEQSLLLGVLNEKENTHFKIVKFDQDVIDLRLDPGDMPGSFKFGNLSVEKISFASYFKLAFEKYANLNGNEGVLKLIKKGYRKWREHGLRWVIKRAETLLINHSSDSGMQQGYEAYKYTEQDPVNYLELASDPLLSIIIPFHSGDFEFLNTCLDSVKRQSYAKYEIIIVGNSVSGLSGRFGNSQIKTLEVISDNFMDHINTAIPYISGDYSFILEEEDFISVNAFYYASQAIKETKSELIYMDEDRFIGTEHFSPLLKGNYILADIKNISEFIGPVFVKSDILKESLGIHLYTSLKDKLILQSNVIQHIPQVMYHKRATVSQWQEAEKEKVKIIPFYLPQYHEIPENDEWWGKGFTEWTNVTKALPLYEEHYQPHVPTDLGYYNLVKDKDIKERQVELANKYNIFGFCYYYYWFNGKRLLEKPLNDVLENKELDFPFCICWANESWSRRWDGQEKELLMQQIHDEDSDKRFIEEVIPMLKDSRYICIEDGVPIILIYRAELFPDLKNTVKYWKEKCRANGIKDLHVCMVQSFGQQDPEIHGCDSAVEFPPHGVYAAEISDQIKGLDPEFDGNIYNYKEVVERNLRKKNSSDYKWFRGAMLSWDNTARRKKSSNIFFDASPGEYEKWMIGLIDYTRKFNEKDNQIVFVNAWNEWAEGTHLEPDTKYGHGYLEATQRALNVR